MDGRGPKQPYLGDLQTIVINHWLTGMILQVTASQGGSLLAGKIH